MTHGPAPGEYKDLVVFLAAAGVMGGHTVAVTLLSRGEVNGTTTTTASGVAAGTALIAGSVMTGAVKAAGTGSSTRVLAVLAATAAYVARCAPAQLRAAGNPEAKNALTATKAGIRAMVPLQAALTLRHGNVAAAAALAAVDLFGKILRSRPRSRRISES